MAQIHSAEACHSGGPQGRTVGIGAPVTFCRTRASFSPRAGGRVKAIACELPARLGLPFSRLPVPDIQAEVVSRGLVGSISGMTIWRWLNEDAIKPWTHRSWIFPRDPDFEPKAARVLDLYARQFEGRHLKPDEFVISADEKTSIQARIRRCPTVAANSRHPMLVEHEYGRGGSLAYLAAWDVHRAKLVGRLEPTTGIEPFGRLVSQVMAEEPYRSARRVFWVLDSGSSHRGEAAVRRLQEAYANLVPVLLPIHASWLNQVEIYFSVLQRRVLTPPDAASLDDLAANILAFQAGYEILAKPSSGSSREPISPSCSTASLRRTVNSCRMRREYITELPCWSTKRRFDMRTTGGRSHRVVQRTRADLCCIPRARELGYTVRECPLE